MQENNHHSGHELQMVQDKIKRINLKSKRKRTLIKKAIEVSHMCNLDIYIIINDRDCDKVIQYQSSCGSSTTNSALDDDADKAVDESNQAPPKLFTLEKAVAILKSEDGKQRTKKLYTDQHYNQLCVNQKRETEKRVTTVGQKRNTK